VRGGLDDALDKLARRDELRRRATGEAPGTPVAVTELVEAVAAVVARHPELGVSVGVEGAGDPLLLHFYVAEGQVQVNAESAAALAPDPAGTRHADFDLDADEPAERPWPTYNSAPPAPDQQYYESETAEQRYGSFEADDAPRDREPGESSRDLGARLRDLGMVSGDQPATYPPHPFAATPPPPVPQPVQQPAATDSLPPQPRPAVPPQDDLAGATRRIQPEQHRPPTEPPARGPVPEQRGMPAPLPQPIPLQVERPEETEIAARRLTALLRDDPSLLDQPRS